MLNANAKVLVKYMPEEAALLISDWIDKYRCEFKISKSRQSKFGDYRAPFQGKGHRISVNHNLNKYAFLVTTVHEFAHLVTYNQWQHKVKPHGIEWKNNFKKMMLPFFEMRIFPPDIESAVASYLKNPAASSCSDARLFKTLRSYDTKDESMVSIEQVATNQTFSISGGRVFKKISKNRTRYRCIEVETGKVYLFSPLAEVKVLPQGL
ncbi:sprT domain-containing protein [Pseudoxanthomonas sp. SGD-10]|nr:sprT domain-containing protein [Pseudoxanthomonas sp. SGD-10]